MLMAECICKISIPKGAYIEFYMTLLIYRVYIKAQLKLGVRVRLQRKIIVVFNRGLNYSDSFIKLQDFV
ncbi:hypothetical protein SAMN05421832_102344 [Psychrobacillus psychrodurans]|nr:hypothetical protein SAMN05421832_102344 [Psychrobacillus psychrodurans]